MREEITAVLYAAKSTEDKHGSIPAQLADCRLLAEREGWTILDEFQDESFSAYSGNRGPGLEQAKALAASHSAVLAAVDADRFARGAGDAPGAAEHLGEVYFQMKRQGVELWTVRSGRLDLLRAAFEGERSHDESARKSQAVKAGMDRSARKGKAQGGHSYGYRYGQDKNNTGQLVLVPHEAEIVRRIFHEFLAGASLSQIARTLHRDGVRTRNGGLWRQSTVAGILRNRVLTGCVMFGGEPFPATHEPIIDVDTFEQSQILLGARRQKRTGRAPVGRHLFTGRTLRCGTCGEPMVPRTRPDWDYYYCNGRSKMGKDFCHVTSVRRIDVDTKVLDYFLSAGLDLEATKEALQRQIASRQDSIHSLVSTALKAEREATAALQRVKRDYLSGALPVEDYNSFKSELEQELAGAVGELQRLRAQERELDPSHMLDNLESGVLLKLAEIRAAILGEVNDSRGIEAVRAALLRLFERFVIHLEPAQGRRAVRSGRIEAMIRPEHIATVDAQLRPILRPAALELSDDFGDQGFPCLYESGPS